MPVYRRQVEIVYTTPRSEETRRSIEALGTAADTTRRRIVQSGADGSRALRQISTSADGLRRSAQTIAVLQGPLGAVSGRISSLASLIGSVNPLIAVSAVGFAGLATTIGRSVAVAEEFERATLKTEAILKATGNASGQTAASIRSLSHEIAATTLASTQGVERAAQKLLTFRSVTGETFRRTLELSQDLAEVGFGSIETAVVQLGKALEDPAQGLSALTRVGVSFSEQQKEQIQTLYRSGRSLEAHRVLLDAVERQVGGAGAAAAGGLTGAYDSLGQAYEDFLEKLGRSSTALALQTGLINLLTRSLRGWESALFGGGDDSRFFDLMDRREEAIKSIADAQAAGNAALAQVERDRLAGIEAEIEALVRKQAAEAKAAAAARDAAAAVQEQQQAENEANRAAKVQELIDAYSREAEVLKLSDVERQKRVAADKAEASARREIAGVTETQVAAIRAAAEAAVAEGAAAAAARQESEKRASEERRLSDLRAETIDGLRVELAQQEALRQAHLEGRDAVEDVTDAQKAYTIIQKLKLAGDSEEAETITELVVKINEQKRAIEGIVEAQKEGERAARKLAAEQKKAAEDASRAYAKVIDEIARNSQEKLGDAIFDHLKGETVDFAQFLKDTIIRAFADIAAAALTQQIVIPIATQVVGAVPGLFGLSGQAAGLARGQSGGGLFGSGNPLSSLTNLIPTDGLYNSFAMSGLGQSLGLSYGAGTLATAPGMFFAGGAVPGAIAASPALTLAATGPAGGFGTLAGISTASTGGAVGAATAGGSLAASGGLTGLGAGLGAALPYIGAAIAIASIFGPMLFGGNPSVGPVGIADFSPGLGRRGAFDVPGITPFTSDNGGNAEGLRPIAEAIADLIADSADRFSATIEQSLRFRVANYQSPESGSGRQQGFEVNAFIRGEAEKRVAEGLSQEQAIFEAFQFAVQEAFKFDSATLAEAAANTAATTTEELLSDLEFADHFDRLNTALDDLGGTVNANTLALAQSTVAAQDAARTWAEQNAQPITDSLSKALELFPAEVTKQVSGPKSVKSVLVGTVGEDERYLVPGDEGYDAALAAPGARVLDRIVGISEQVTATADNYADNLDRISRAVEIGAVSFDLLGQQVAGTAEQVIGPAALDWQQTQANIEALRGPMEDWNEQIEAANAAFPELNAALIDVDQTISDLLDTAGAQARQDFLDTIQAQTNAATGLGVINTIQGLVDTRDVNLSDAAALGIEFPQDGPNPVLDLFDAQLRQSLSGASLADLNEILKSGQIIDAGAQAIVQTILGEKALADVRTAEVANMQSLFDEHQRFADAANDNARKLREAANGLLVNRDLSPLSPLDRLNEARRQFNEAFALANDSDPTDAESQYAIQQLPGLSETLLQASRDYYASSSGYLQDFNRVQDALNSTALRQESIEQQQLDAMRDIEKAIQDLGGSLTNQTPAQIAAAGGFDFGRQTSKNQGIYNDLIALGLPTPDAFGGGQLNALRAANPAVDAYLRAKGYADGGLITGGIPGMDSVPLWAMPGERIFSVPHSRMLENLAANQGAGPSMVSELRALRSEVERLRTAVGESGRQVAATTAAGSLRVAGAVMEGNAATKRMASSAERNSARPVAA